MAKKAAATAPKASSIDSAGHTHSPLDPEVTPRKTKEASKSKTLKWAKPLLAITTLGVFLVTVAWFVKGRDRDTVRQTVSTPTVVPAVSVPQSAPPAIPSTSQDKSEWAIAELAPRETRRFAVPPKGRLEFFGSDVCVHCKYGSDHALRTVSFGEGETPCPSADDMKYYDIENLRDGPNIIRYAQAPLSFF